MPRAFGATALSLSLLLMPACGGLETLGPTPPDEGIVIFVHADFAGTSQGINADVRDLSKVEGPCTSGAEGEQPTWGDCLSSVRVMPGWTATLYEDDDFRGRSIVVDADAPNLRNVPGPCDGSLNDCVSSIRVSRK
jgi:hypothetical protein